MAMLPRVEALAADRARLKAVNGRPATPSSSTASCRRMRAGGGGRRRTSICSPPAPGMIGNSPGEDVHVSGAAPQKCFYGTTKCRGHIGGDISGSGIIAQDDVEAEYFEPIITNKNAEEMVGNADCSHAANSSIVEHETSIQREDSNNCPSAIPHMDAWSPQDAEDVTRTPVHVSRTIETYLQQVPVCSAQPLELLAKIPNTADELTAPTVTKRSAPSSNLGSSLVHGFHAKKKNSLKKNLSVKPPCPIDNDTYSGS